VLQLASDLEVGSWMDVILVENWTDVVVASWMNARAANAEAANLRNVRVVEKFLVEELMFA